MADPTATDTTAPLTDVKSFLESKTIWGIIIAAGAPWLAKHGYIVDPTGLATDWATLIGAALAVYGRLTASKGLAIK